MNDYSIILIKHYIHFSVKKENTEFFVVFFLWKNILSVDPDHRILNASKMYLYVLVISSEALRENSAPGRIWKKCDFSWTFFEKNQNSIRRSDNVNKDRTMKNSGPQKSIFSFFRSFSLLPHPYLSSAFFERLSFLMVDT